MPQLLKKGIPVFNFDKLDKDKNLSQRELECLWMAANGLNNRQTGQQLLISGHTVKNHLSKARRKLKADSTTHAVYLCFAKQKIKVSEETLLLSNFNT